MIPRAAVSCASHRDPVFWVAVFGGCAAALGVSRALHGVAPAEGWLSFVVLVPVAEELIFRGWLQPKMLKSRWGARAWRSVTTANVATSILFVGAHFFAQPPLWALSVFLPSLAFGYMRDRHASVLPAILLHVAFNGSLLAG